MNNNEKTQGYLDYEGLDLSKEKFDAVICFNSEDPQLREFDNNKLIKMAQLPLSFH